MDGHVTYWLEIHGCAFMLPGRLADDVEDHRAVIGQVSSQATNPALLRRAFGFLGCIDRVDRADTRATASQGTFLGCSGPRRDAVGQPGVARAFATG